MRARMFVLAALVSAPFGHALAQEAGQGATPRFESPRGSLSLGEAQTPRATQTPQDTQTPRVLLTPQAVPAPLPEGEARKDGEDLAYGAFQRGHFLTAFLRATKRVEADAADAAAMTLLGLLHDQGLGVQQDAAKAAGWYRLAARAGDVHATFGLAMMTIEGRGVARDPAQGRAGLERAAERGHALAAHNLALILLGSQDEDDLTRAVALLKQAAQAEIPDAQHALGVLYAKGRGVAEDDATAASWLERAAANFNVAGEVEYAIALFNGRGVAKDEARAARFFRRAAFKGNPIAQNRLARLYAAGRGLERDLIEAAAWHLLAAGSGLSDAWLDEALKDLSADQRREAEELAAARSSPG